MSDPRSGQGLGALVTEARNESSQGFDEMSSREIVETMAREDRGIADAVHAEAESIAQAIDGIAERFGRGGRLFYVGAGTSGRLGVLDAVECPPTFCTSPDRVVGLIAGGPAALTSSIEGAEDDPEGAYAELDRLGLDEGDAVVGIAASGRTPYVVGALEFARRRGAFTVGLACNASSNVGRAAAVEIAPVVGPEVLAGSTRLKAGTATKMVLNMLSTGVMARCGKIFDNCMVDVAATNDKLRDRATRMVIDLAGLDEPSARDLLASCDFEVKTALVAHGRGVDAAVARRILATFGGRVRAALAEEEA